MRIDLVGVNLVRIDLVAQNPIIVSARPYRLLRLKDLHRVLIRLPYEEKPTGLE